MIQDAAERMRATLTMRDITVHSENFLDDRKFFRSAALKFFTHALRQNLKFSFQGRKHLI